MRPLTILEHYEPIPEKKAELHAELKAIAETTRVEPGCISVKVLIDFRAGTFLLRSEWASEAAFELHSGLLHVQRFCAISRDLLAKPVESMRVEGIV